MKKLKSIIADSLPTHQELSIDKSKNANIRVIFYAYHGQTSHVFTLAWPHIYIRLLETGTHQVYQTILYHKEDLLNFWRGKIIG